MKPARKIAATLVLASLVVALAGCSTGPAVEAKDEPVSATPTGTPAPPSATAAPITSESAPSTTAGATADPAAPVLEGTSWSGTDSDGDAYVYRFAPGGQYNYTSPNGDFTGDKADTWSQTGNQVVMKPTNGYATYTGTVQGDTISGSATNVRGHTWTWSAQRQ